MSEKQYFDGIDLPDLAIMLAGKGYDVDIETIMAGLDQKRAQYLQATRVLADTYTGPTLTDHVTINSLVGPVGMLTVNKLNGLLTNMSKSVPDEPQALGRVLHRLVTLFSAGWQGEGELDLSDQINQMATYFPNSTLELTPHQMILYVGLVMAPDGFFKRRLLSEQLAESVVTTLLGGFINLFVSARLADVLAELYGPAVLDAVAGD